MTNTPFLSPDGKFWIDPSDGRSVPVVRGGSDIGAGDPPAAPSPAPEAAPAADPAPASSAPAADPEHSFATVDEAVAALRETRAEAAQRRVEAKTLKEQVEKFDKALAGYKPEEVDYLLDMFHDLSDPQAQKRAAKELAEIASKVLDAEDGTLRPTGEEDPDSKPLTKREWKELQAQRDTEQAQSKALEQLEAAATEKGYPPSSPGYTVLLASMMEPDVAGDIDKAVDKVKAYEKSIVEAYAKTVEANGERWPGSAPGSPTPPADPEAGVKAGWGNARAAAAAFLKSRAGQAS